MVRALLVLIFSLWVAAPVHSGDCAAAGAPVPCYPADNVQLQTDPTTNKDLQRAYDEGDLGGGGHIIEDESVPLPQQPTLDFRGGGIQCLDAPIEEKTVCTVPGGETGGQVDSVFGRIGDVIAVPGDYQASQVSNTPSGGVGSANVQGAIDELDAEKATNSALNTHKVSADHDSRYFTETELQTGPCNSGTEKQIGVDTDGSPICATDQTGDVDSVFGRTGAVVAAPGDYTGAQVTNVPSGGISSTNTQGAINELEAEKATVQELSDHKVGGDHDGRYFQQTELQAGPCDSVDEKQYGVDADGSPLCAEDQAGTGHEIQDEGIALPTQPALNFIGPGVTCGDNPGNSRTDCAIPGSPVDSVFGRTGAVTAQTDDYTGTQITNTPAGTIQATNVQGAVNELDGDVQTNAANLTTHKGSDDHDGRYFTETELQTGTCDGGTDKMIGTNPDGSPNCVPDIVGEPGGGATQLIELTDVSARQGPNPGRVLLADPGSALPNNRCLRTGPTGQLEAATEDCNTAVAETDPIYSADPAASITDAGSGQVITGTERTKLAGIEEGATGDMTNDEIRDANNAASNSNTFTDSEKTKLSGLVSDRVSTNCNAETGGVAREVCQQTTDNAFWVCEPGDAPCGSGQWTQYESDPVFAASAASGVTDAGSGQVITAAERNKLAATNADRISANCAGETGGVANETCWDTVEETIYQCEAADAPCGSNDWTAYAATLNQRNQINANAIFTATHPTSADHDGRYFTETELQAGPCAAGEKQTGVDTDGSPLCVAEEDPIYSGAPASAITNAGSGQVISASERTKLTGLYPQRTSSDCANEVGGVTNEICFDTTLEATFNCQSPGNCSGTTPWTRITTSESERTDIGSNSSFRTAHPASADHDGRYFTQTELQAGACDSVTEKQYGVDVDGSPLCSTDREGSGGGTNAEQLLYPGDANPYVYKSGSGNSTVNIDYNADGVPDIVFDENGSNMDAAIVFDEVVDVSQEADPCLALRQAACRCTDTDRTGPYSVLVKGQGEFTFAQVATAAAEAFDSELNYCLVAGPQLTCDADGFPATFATEGEDNVLRGDGTQCIWARDSSYALNYNATGQNEPVVTERWGFHSLMGSDADGDKSGEIRDNGLVLADLGSRITQTNGVLTAGWLDGRSANLSPTLTDATWIGVLLDHIKNVPAIANGIGTIDCVDGVKAPVNTGDDVGLYMQQLWGHTDIFNESLVRDCGVGYKAQGRLQASMHVNARSNHVGVHIGDDIAHSHSVDYAADCPKHPGGSCVSEFDPTMGGVIRGIVELNSIAGLAYGAKIDVRLEDLYAGWSTGSGEISIIHGNGFDSVGNRICAIDNQFGDGETCDEVSTADVQLVYADNLKIDQFEASDLINSGMMLGPEAKAVNPDSSRHLIRFTNSQLQTLCDATDDTKNCGAFRAHPDANTYVDVTGSFLLSTPCTDTTPADGDCDNDIRIRDPIPGRLPIYANAISAGETGTYDVTYYGATGVADGNDDADAFGAAITSAGLAGGGIVSAGCGTYEIFAQNDWESGTGAALNGFFLDYSNVKLRGSGECSVVQPHPDVVNGIFMVSACSDRQDDGTRDNTQCLGTVGAAVAGTGATTTVTSDSTFLKNGSALDAEENAYFIEYKTGAAAGQVRRVTVVTDANTATTEAFSPIPAAGDNFILYPEKLYGQEVSGFHFFDNDPAGHSGIEESHGIIVTAAQIDIEGNTFTELGDEGVVVSRHSSADISHNRFRGVPAQDVAGASIEIIRTGGSNLITGNTIVHDDAFPGVGGFGIAITDFNKNLAGMDGSLVIDANTIKSIEPHGNMRSGIRAQSGNGYIENVIISDNYIDLDYYKTENLFAFEAESTYAIAVDFVGNQVVGLMKFDPAEKIGSSFNATGNRFFSRSASQTRGTFVELGQSENILFADNRLGPYKSGAILISGTSGGGSGVVTIEGNTFTGLHSEGTGDDASIWVFNNTCPTPGFEKLTIANNHFGVADCGETTCTNRMIFGAPCEMHVSGNTFDARAGGEVKVNFGLVWGGPTFIGNTFFGSLSSRPAIDFRDGSDYVVSNNLFLDQAGYVIDTDNASNATITGNIMEVTSSPSQALRGPLTDSVISNNISRGSTNFFLESGASARNICTGNRTEGTIVCGADAEGLGGREGCTDNGGVGANGSVCGLNIQQ